MRFYNGVAVSNRSSDAAERLVNKYLSNVRKARRKSEDYGGSTGGRKTIDRNPGLAVIRQRSSNIGDLRKVFNQEGTGRFGARKEAWIAKQYDPDVRKAMEDRQSGKDKEEGSPGVAVDPV